MYNFRKTLCLAVLLCVAVTFVFAGCGVKNDPSAPAGTTAAQSAEQPTVVEQEPYEVNYYYVSGGAQPNNAKIEEAASKYLKETLGINSTLKLNCLDWGTYDQKIRTMLTASDYLDILWSTNWAVDTFARVRDGSFLELEDLLEKTPKLKAELGTLLDKAKINGKYYVIPQKKESTFCQGILYNKTLADKYGIDMTGVTSMETLEPKLKEFHEKEPNIPAWHGGMGYATNVNYDINEFGILENGKFVSRYHHEGIKSRALLLNKWASLDYISKDAATKDAGPIIDEGNFFVFSMNDGFKPGYADEANSRFKYVSQQIDFTQPYTGTWSIFGTTTSISRTSKNPERAMLVLEALMTDKYLTNLINFGIEGENYKKLDENTIELIPDTGYAPGVSWEIGNRSLCYLMQTENKELYKMYADAAANAELSQCLGFIMDNTPVATEKAALDNVFKEYERAIMAGLIDEAHYGQFLTKLEKAGLQKVLDEMQKQYDEWKTKQ